MYAGKPLPPTDLSVYINEECEIQLKWKSPFILSSTESTKSRILTPQYIVYGFLMRSGITKDLFYRRETNSSSTNYTLKDFESFGFSVTNVSSFIAFGVSTKLTIVGEGNMSAHGVVRSKDIQAVCKLGTCYKYNHYLN